MPEAVHGLNRIEGHRCAIAHLSGCDDNFEVGETGRCVRGVFNEAEHEEIEMNEVATNRPASTDTARIIYILYLVGFAAGITAVIGLVMAYVNRDDAPEWLRSHYDFQIRTFWIGLLYCVIGGILSVVLVGVLVLLFAAVWLIIRVVKGFKFLEQRQPVPDVGTWMF